MDELRAERAALGCVGRLGRISVFPVKSLDGEVVEQARLLAAGSLEYDRRYAIVDMQGSVVNAKRTERIQLIRSRFDLNQGSLSLAAPGMPAQSFSLPSQQAAAEAWLSRYFGFDLRLEEGVQHGFPDDNSALGPTVVSTATLQEVARWFDLDLDEVRRRFRANLEVEDVPAFWEDCLYGPAGQTRRFLVGEAVLEGTNPCQRCVVPSRSARDARPWPGFSRHFAEQRAATLPPWAPRDRFDHYYRLAVNTRLCAGAGSVLRVGDAVRLAEGST